MSIGQLRNQMVGEPTRVPGYAEGYGQAPGQARPSMPAQPNPIGRPTLVVGGPSYYVPPGYQAPPQPTEAFLPTDVRPDPIGQQFMRQLESPMGQQFQQQYEATQAPLRQAERERQEAELARRDERFQELMDRIAQLEGQLGAQEEAPVMPNVPTFPIGDGFEIDFSQIPNFGNFLNFGNQMEPFEREDYQDLMSEIDNLPSPPSIDPNIAAEQEMADRGMIGTGFQDFSKRLGQSFRPGGDGQLIPIDELRISEPIPMPMPSVPAEPKAPKIVPKMPSAPKITTPVIPPMPPIQITRQPIPRVEVPVNLPEINIPQIEKFVPPPVPQAVGSPLIRGNIRDIPTFDLPTTVPRSVIGKLAKGPGI